MEVDHSGLPAVYMGDADGPGVHADATAGCFCDERVTALRGLSWHEQ